MRKLFLGAIIPALVIGAIFGWCGIFITQNPFKYLVLNVCFWTFPLYIEHVYGDSK